VAIVTGSRRGIGKTVALRLARLGAAVVINDVVDPQGMEQVVGEVRESGGEAMAIQADVSRADQASRLVEETVAAWGKMDILVNNAGIARDALLPRLAEEEWDQVLAINLKGAFLCTKAALRPMLRQRWGRIINMASVVGLAGNPGQANYAAAKGGLVAFTRTVAREVASRGITANAIAPGFIDTDMTRSLAPKVKEEIIKGIPLGYFGSPEDVAGVVAFFASEDARYITGQVLVVDGGMVMA
jgi:3-oxoacyl-[acyl-carrier protein] reductase